MEGKAQKERRDVLQFWFNVTTSYPWNLPHSKKNERMEETEHTAGANQNLNKADHSANGAEHQMMNVIELLIWNPRFFKV